MMTSQNILKTTFLLGLATLLAACANLGQPTGGEKDTKSPQVIESQPIMGATNFSGKELVLEFDEFVQMKNPAQQILISPSLNKKPEFKLKGKNLRIRFNEDLLKETTYTINFGQSVSDITEGNVLKNYQFVFSTGSKIDQGQFKGTILNAQSNEAEAKSLALLYPANLPDTALSTTNPMYFAACDENGQYKFSNLKEGDYKLFGLIDKNANYRYDQKDEAFAFLGKTLSVDTSLQTAPNLLLSVGQESGLRIVQAKFSPPSTIMVLSNRPLLEEESISGPNLFYQRLNPGRDSIKLFLKTNALDSIPIYLNGSTQPERYILTRTLDDETIQSSYPLKVQRSQSTSISNRKAKQPSKNNNFSIRMSQDGLLEIPWNRPLSSFDQNKIFLLSKSDSSKHPAVISIDAVDPQKLRVSSEWLDTISYQLVIGYGAIKDYAGFVNQKTTVNIRKAHASGNASLALKLNQLDPQVHYILKVSVLNGRKISSDRIINQSSFEKKFNNLSSGKYAILVIEDLNQDGFWTPGNFEENRQPEKIYKPKDPPVLRANWELDLEILTKTES